MVPEVQMSSIEAAIEALEAEVEQSIVQKEAMWPTTGPSKRRSSAMATE